MRFIVDISVLRVTSSQIEVKGNQLLRFPGGGGYKTCVENGLFVVCLLFDFTDKHTKLKRTGIELRNFDDLDSKCLIAFNVMFL